MYLLFWLRELVMLKGAYSATEARFYLESLDVNKMQSLYEAMFGVFRNGLYCMGRNARKTVFRVSDIARLKPAYSATETS